MNVIDEVIAPHAARVLVEAHRPEADDLCLRVGVKFGEFANTIDRDTGQARGFLQVYSETNFAYSSNVISVASFAFDQKLSAPTGCPAAIRSRCRSVRA